MMLTDETLLRPFDSTRWVVAAPGGRNLLLSEDSAELFRLLARAQSLDDAHVAFAARFGSALTAREFMDLVEAQFGGYQLLHADSVAVRPLLPVPELRLRLEFISPALAGRLSAWLRPFYAPTVFWWTSGLLAAGLVAGHLLAPPAQLPVGSQLFVTLPLVYGSMIIHEFGHVAATARAGLKHGGIGCGLYAYLFPVLYADVTGIWLASKQERIIANLGGIYSQVLYAGGLAVGYLLSGYEPLRFAAGAVSLMALWQFNPFVRHDGYWLLSDLTNTPNLLPQAQGLIRRALTRDGQRSALAQVVATRGRALLTPRMALLSYGVVNSALLLFFILYTCWNNAELVLTFPLVVAGLLGKLLTGSLHWADLSRSYLVVFILYVILARYLVGRVRKWKRASQPAPAAL